MDNPPFKVSRFYLDLEAVQEYVRHYVGDAESLTKRLDIARKLAIKHDRQMYVGAYNHLIQMLADWKKTAKVVHSAAVGFAENGVNPEIRNNLPKHEEWSWQHTQKNT